MKKKQKNQKNKKKQRLHYLAVKKSFLYGIASKHKVNCYRLIFLHSFKIGNKYKSHEKVRKNKNFHGIKFLIKK